MENNNSQENRILEAVGALSKKTDESIANLSKKTDESILKLAEKTDVLADEVDALTEKTDEILEAVGHFSNKTEERFNALEGRFDKLDGRVTKIEANMVTKDYLDEKLTDLKGDLTVLMRKEDKKLVALISVLETRKVISAEDANMIMALEPFPQGR